MLLSGRPEIQILLWTLRKADNINVFEYYGLFLPVFFSFFYISSGEPDPAVGFSFMPSFSAQYSAAFHRIFGSITS